MKTPLLGSLFLAGCYFLGSLSGQGLRIQQTSQLVYPVSIVDGNSPSIWVEGLLHVYTSTGDPLALTGLDFSNLRQTASPVITPRDHYPIWIESVWQDGDGTIYGWYHHEPGGVCPNSKLTAPQIGALVSTDGGASFTDLGIVLSTGDPLNCAAANGFFAGGHGDLSVILDRAQNYFYFLFDNYSGPLDHQGVAIARMRFEDRQNPVGTVSKYYAGAWTEAGIGGLVTPIFQAAASWEGSATDALWGPAIHWNTYLNAYVILFNRSCCKSGWPQEGIYLSISTDLTDPGLWTQPTKIMYSNQIGFSPGYYPQVVSLDPGGTDTTAGKFARLYIKGISKWEVEFLTAEELADSPLPTVPDPPIDAGAALTIPIGRIPRK